VDFALKAESIEETSGWVGASQFAEDTADLQCGHGAACAVSSVWWGRTETRLYASRSASPETM